MYHPGKTENLSSRIAFSPEKQLFLQGGNAFGDSGLVLSTDVKPRLKWTAELHEHFTEAVNQLGGANKATPKTVMRLMGIPGLTLYHLKSHLQKYRLSKNVQGQASNGAAENVTGSAAELVDKRPEISGLPKDNSEKDSQISETLQIAEALMMQIEVQRQLNEQVEVQRRLQLRIEAQGRYLQSVLEKAQETLGKQKFSSTGLHATRAQLSESVPNVSNECLGTGFHGLKEIPRLQKLQVQTAQVNGTLMDSSLASFAETQKDQDSASFGLRSDNNLSLQSHQKSKLDVLEETKPAKQGDMNMDRQIPSLSLKEYDRTIVLAERDPTALKISSTIHGLKESRKHPEVGTKEGNIPKRNRSESKQDKEMRSSEYGFSCLTTQLDLNTHEGYEGSQGVRNIDLNGFSWS